MTQLSASLHNIFDLMNTDMKQVGTAWQDGKYEEFVNGYKPQINKCEEISVRYSEWCKKVLAPTIENVIAVENTDVVGNGGGTVGAVAGGAVATVGVASGFNIDGKNDIIGKSSKNKSSNLNSSVRSNVKNGLANEHCEEMYGEGYHAESLKQGETAHEHLAYSVTTNGETTKGSVDADLNAKILGFGGEIKSKMEYDSGGQSKKIDASSSFNCVPDNE